MLKPEQIEIDQIAATLEIFENTPQSPKPHPIFWDEVLRLAEEIDETIEVWSIERCTVEILETLCQLRIVADDLKRRHDSAIEAGSKQ
jgi:hypothetical protein